MTTRDYVCGKPTKKGTSCTRPLHYWEARTFEFDRADGCWHHMSQPFKEASAARKRAEEEAWLAYLYADPICWRWIIPSNPDEWMHSRERTLEEQLVEQALGPLASDPESKAATLLVHWQDGRCAICGHRRDLVEDHDHATGMIRGWLCYGCNTKEGIYRDPDTLFGKYRERHPTKMLGLRLRRWDPIVKDYARPAAQRVAEDPWTDAASEDIGL